jgi:hypothetical protein
MFSTQANVNVITSKQVQNSFNRITVNTVQTCVSDTNATQTFTVTGNNNDIENFIMTQSVQNNLTCLTSSDTQLEIVNNLGAKLQNQVNTNASTMFGWAVNVNVIDQETIQNIVTEHMITVIQGCAQTFNLSQDAFIGGDYNKIVNATMSQSGSQFAQCVFDSTNVDSVSNKIAADINNRADTTTSTFSNMIGWVIIIAVAVGGGVALIKVGSDARRKTNLAQGLPVDYKPPSKKSTTSIARPTKPTASKVVTSVKPAVKSTVKSMVKPAVTSAVNPMRVKA